MLSFFDVPPDYVIRFCDVATSDVVQKRHRPRLYRSRARYMLSLNSNCKDIFERRRPLHVCQEVKNEFKKQPPWPRPRRRSLWKFLPFWSSRTIKASEMAAVKKIQEQFSSSIHAQGFQNFRKYCILCTMICTATLGVSDQSILQRSFFLVVSYYVVKEHGYPQIALPHSVSWVPQLYAHVTHTSFNWMLPWKRKKKSGQWRTSSSINNLFVHRPKLPSNTGRQLLPIVNHKYKCP